MPRAGGAASQAVAVNGFSTARPDAAGRVYEFYGLRLRSEFPLAASIQTGRRRGAVRLRCRGPKFFARVRARAGVRDARAPWFVHAGLRGGGDYLRWSGLFEFAVSADGRAIAARPLDGASPETLQAYLLGQVLSFALVRRGIEPLHATAVVVDGGAVAFLGDCGTGKSTLGAALLRAGCPILTDDVFVVTERRGRFVAWDGPPRIKLFPEVADRLLDGGAGSPMNGLTPKRLIPLDGRQHAAGPVPVAALFVLAPRSSGRRSVSIRRLPAQRACIELIRNTFNTMIAQRDRLARQFALAGRVAESVPVFSLSYPRELGRLPEVVAAIRERLGRDHAR